MLSINENEQNVNYLEPAQNTLSVGTTAWPTQISINITVGKITPIGLVPAYSLVSTQFIQHQRRLLTTPNCSYISSEIFAINIITTAVIPRNIIRVKSQLEITYGSNIATQSDEHKMALKSILKSKKRRKEKNPCHGRLMRNWPTIVSFQKECGLALFQITHTHLKKRGSFPATENCFLGTRRVPRYLLHQLKGTRSEGKTSSKLKARGSRKSTIKIMP
ncbi:hypothetical protein CEXT_108971 [Caerostris extrusa]|uniref:Uncharacterized protein n=1 Tax=Caerostris extrusa TaxID=172846 RepID=A0AAV4VGL3_CAEEX|nr:hypothetical protein CEXT_108971 [Caerostris extrusa]